MLQVVQNQRTGHLYVEEVPRPQLRKGGALVANAQSLISVGTERTSVATAQASLIGKARLRPDLVQQVIESVRREGLAATYRKVRARLDRLKALGYSCAGVVIGSACDEFQIGDRVACAGNGYACHAEVVYVPKNLCVKVPDGVGFEEAAFTTLGGIATHAVRQSEARLGESVVVIGLGLVGQLTVQVLKAAGCRVLGMDMSSQRLEVASACGADRVLQGGGLAGQKAVEAFSGGVGADAVILTAATRSNEPVETAARVCRDRGRIVVVGAVGADLPRGQFYEKELELRMSRSYGPGRYDATYEVEGVDYPIGYVRWTEKRNMEAFLWLVAEKRVDVRRLITHRFDIQEAAKAYDLIQGKTEDPYLGVLLTYSSRSAGQPGPILLRPAERRVPGHGLDGANARITIGMIGAGNFAQAQLLPYLRGSPWVQLKTVATLSSASARAVADKFGFSTCTAEPGDVLEDPEIEAVFVVTRHDSHARFVLHALRRGKQVFVEKPLAVTKEELQELATFAAKVSFEERSEAPRLMVGYNRRFSAPLQRLKEHFADRTGPLAISYRVNAGPLSASSWYVDGAQGGRFVGEACHFVDSLQYLTGARPIRVFSECISGESRGGRNRDSVIVTLKFSDGSIGTIVYLCNGDPVVPKEYVEVFGDEAVGRLEDFRRLDLVRQGKRERLRFNGDKGHAEEMRAVIDALRLKLPMPVSFESLYATAETTLAAAQSLEIGEPVELGNR